jgi:hypothetical protein
MKNKKIKELIMDPLRFHHQDIHQELEELKIMVRDLSNQMQELQHAIRGTSDQEEIIPAQELYEHPWYKYKREELIATKNYKN